MSAVRKITVNVPAEILDEATRITGRGVTATVIEGLAELQRQIGAHRRRLDALGAFDANLAHGIHAGRRHRHGRTRCGRGGYRLGCRRWRSRVGARGQALGEGRLGRQHERPRQAQAKRPPESDPH
jgi:hypothetical protein